MSFEKVRTFDVRNLRKYKDRNKFIYKIKTVAGNRDCYGLKTFRSRGLSKSVKLKYVKQR